MEYIQQGGFFLAALTHGYSGYVGIIVMIFDVQSHLDDVIGYYLQFLEKRFHTFFQSKRGFLIEKDVFWMKKECF